MFLIEERQTGDSRAIYVGPGVAVIGCAVYDNGYRAQSSSAGICAREGCTLKNNVVYRNGWGCGISAGIYAPFYCLLDGNSAYEQEDNIFTTPGCVLGLNFAP